MRRKLPRILLSLMIVVGFLLPVAGVVQNPFLTTLENLAYDGRVRLTMPGGVDERIVIVDLDEKSLAAEGQWPWSRDKLARMLDQLFDYYEIAVLGFDIVFAEKDNRSGLPFLEALAEGPLKTNPAYLQVLEENRPALELDRRFARAMRDRPVVTGFFANPPGAKKTIAGVLPRPVLLEGQGPLAGHKVPFFQANGYGGNLKVLQDAAMDGGFFSNPDVDPDGVFRRLPMLASYEGKLYQSLSLAVVRTLLGDPDITPVFGKGYQEDAMDLGLEQLRIDDFELPVDARSSLLVPFRGPQGSFPYVSATDVLHQRADKGVLENTIVLVGTTAAGLLDTRTTPVQSVYAGVEVHANVVAGILDGTIWQHPAYVKGIEFLQIMVLGLLLTFLLPRFSPMAGTLLTIALIGIVVWANLYAWREEKLVVELALPLLLIVSLYLFHMAYGFFVESRGKRQLSNLFGQYVPPELVEEMDADIGKSGLRGESREMTVLFSDVRGFTTISEGLDPGELTDLMNELLTPMTRIIHKHRGTIDKYMGDAIMAFWGAPLDDSEHAHHALSAALDMVKTIKERQLYFSQRGWPPIRMGVGLNTGKMSVGNMGSAFRMAYTVLGDAVNLGSRLEGLTKQYGLDILVSETTRAAAPRLNYRQIDTVRVKGKDLPVTIFEPLSEEIEPQVAERLESYHQALELYRGQQWDAAEEILLALQAEEPERVVYQVYLERIAHFREDPPGQDWDGVFTHTSK